MTGDHDETAKQVQEVLTQCAVGNMPIFRAQDILVTPFHVQSLCAPVQGHTLTLRHHTSLHLTSIILDTFGFDMSHERLLAPISLKLTAWPVLFELMLLNWSTFSDWDAAETVALRCECSSVTALSVLYTAWIVARST